jgi:hypothetical protein
VKLWRRAAPLVSTRRGVYRAAYRAALDRIAEAGWSRRFGETREQFAARLKKQSPLLEQLTRDHVGSRFGAQTLDAPREVRKLAMRAGVDAQKQAPLWRVILGIANPISWIWTR